MLLLLLLLLLGLWSIEIGGLHQSDCNFMLSAKVKKQQIQSHTTRTLSAYLANTHIVKLTQGLHVKVSVMQGMQRGLGNWGSEGGLGNPRMLRV